MRWRVGDGEKSEKMQSFVDSGTLVISSYYSKSIFVGLNVGFRFNLSSYQKLEFKYSLGYFLS